MKRSSQPTAGPAGPGVEHPARCPMCRAELTDDASTGICTDCNWVQRFPAD